MQTKICTKCGKEYSIEEFNWRDKKKGSRRSECKYCHSKYMRDKYAQKQKTVQELKKDSCCAKCGDTREYILDYHHIDPSIKENTVARLVSNSYGMDKVLAEIDKCILLCANCHREFHYFNKEKNISLEDYLKQLT